MGFCISAFRGLLCILYTIILYSTYTHLDEFQMLYGNSLGTQIEEPEARIDGVWTWEKNTISIGNMMMGFCFLPNLFRRPMREVDSVWNAYQNIWHWCGRNLFNCQTVALCCYLCIQYIFLHKVECTSFSGIINQHNPTKTLKWENEQVQVNQIECKV